MNKLLIATNMLLLAVIVFQACNPSSTNSIPTKADLYSSCVEEQLPPDSDSVYDEGSIDAHLAREISQLYAADPYKGFMYSPFAVFGTKSKKQDTKSIWFDLRRLKNLIRTIEESVCHNNCEKPLRLGVRIYLAKYKSVTGEDSTDPGMRHILKEYANRTTAFLVGTYDNQKGVHVDFDPMKVGADKCHPIPFKRLLDSLPPGRLNVNAVRLPRANIMFNLQDTTAMNQGDLMPPPDGRGTFPTGENK